MENKYAIKKPFITTMEDDLRRVRSRGAIPPIPPKPLTEKLIGGFTKPEVRETPPILDQKEIFPSKQISRSITERLGIKLEIPPIKFPTINRLAYGKKTLVVIAAVMALVTLVGGIYYYQTAIQKPSVSEPPPLTVIEEEKPLNLIAVARDEVIQIAKDATSARIRDDLINLLSKEYAAGEFSRILVQSSALDEARNIEYRTFSNLSDFVNGNLAINMPAKLLSSFSQFTFFIFAGESSNRLGLVFQIKLGEEISIILNDWEKGSMKDDLAPLLALMEIDATRPDTDLFLDNQYQGAQIRYINFGGPANSIDSAIFQNYFIMATSRDSMYAAIDNLSR